MLGSVYARIFGAANARRDVYELSRRVYEHEDPEFDVDEWVAGAHPLDDHALEHPLVTELVGQDEAGPGAALAYMAEGSESDAPAVIRWMTAGGYKGRFDSDEVFCEDQFADALADHLATWSGAKAIGFPIDGDVIECIDWAEVAHQVFDVWEDVFSSVECDGGVHVFDVSIDIDQYRE